MRACGWESVTGQGHQDADTQREGQSEAVGYLPRREAPRELTPTSLMSDCERPQL